MNRTAAHLFAVLLPVAAAAAQEGGSTFGHARTRELAELGRLPSPAEVAVADIVNYHRHRLPLPRAGEAVALDLRFGGDACPPGPVVLQVGITTPPTGDRQDLPPLNLALVIDCSGSMGEQGKMVEVQRALDAFVRRLRPDDKVALVTYSSAARLAQASQAVGDGRWLRASIDALDPDGATNLHAGLMLGLEEVAAHAGRGTSNRVILLTDGIANRGVTDPDAILAASRAFTAEDVDLSTIGVGQDLNTELLDRLSRGGRGLFHFVADAKDIDKVFVAEMDSLVAPVARQVRLRVDLPPGLCLDRVYGYEVKSCADRRGFTLELPDLNHGVTEVVLATCRVDSRLDSRGDSRLDRPIDWRDAELPGRATARARLDYREAVGGARGSAESEARIALSRQRRTDGDRSLEDPEVRKNFTIAVLAEAMHDMAIAAGERRWWRAQHHVDVAIDFAREQFPNVEDPDLRAVLEMAEQHRTTLRRYVDRFREK